jgi:hypothetical protein
VDNSFLVAGQAGPVAIKKYSGPHMDIETTKELEMETKEENKEKKDTRDLFLSTLIFPHTALCRMRTD